MTIAELDVLEAEVADARRRVADDVARLRSPTALSEFKEDVNYTVSSAAQRAADDLKNRAAANPVAVAAIAAGLLWRFARHPPIATLLVGAGLASLLRTNSSSGPSPIVTRTQELMHTANEKAAEWSEDARAAAARVAEQTQRISAQAGETAERLAAQARETAARLSAQASETATRVSEQAGQTAARVSEQASQLTDRASQTAGRIGTAAQRAFPDSSPRDTFLLGVAAMAIGAAALINYNRRDDSNGRAD